MRPSGSLFGIIRQTVVILGRIFLSAPYTHERFLYYTNDNNMVALVVLR